MGARGALAIQRGATMGQAVGETTDGIKRIEGAIARVAQGALQDHDDWRGAAPTAFEPAGCGACIARAQPFAARAVIASA
jgi:hypothetical protein